MVSIIKRCGYCDKRIDNLYDHLIAFHRTKLLKIIAINNYSKTNNTIDISNEIFRISIKEILACPNFKLIFDPI